MDGEPVYDLEQWNQEYFDRLRRFLERAARNLGCPALHRYRTALVRARFIVPFVEARNTADLIGR